MSNKVHIHTSDANAFYVNSFVIEGDRSLVLVDTQFVLTEIKQVIEMMQAIGKPLAATFITHPHPDHYNGLASVLSAFPGTDVYSTASTLAGIHETAEPKRAYWTPIVGANYPQEFAFPNKIVEDGQAVRIDDIELKVWDLGAAECSDNTMIALSQNDAVIVSDIIYNGVHPWLAEGRSEKWLTALKAAKVRVNGAATLYAGHGAAGNGDLFDQQADYIKNVREMVKTAVQKDRILSDSSKAALREKIKAIYPGRPLEAIIDLNVESLAAEPV